MQYLLLCRHPEPRLQSDWRDLQFPHYLRRWHYQRAVMGITDWQYGESRLDWRRVQAGNPCSMRLIAFHYQGGPFTGPPHWQKLVSLVGDSRSGAVEFRDVDCERLVVALCPVVEDAEPNLL